MIIYKIIFIKFKINGNKVCIFFEYNRVKLEMEKRNFKIFIFKNRILNILYDWWVNEEFKMRVKKNFEDNDKKL